ncbi:MAG: hypothetical protein QOJ40_258 [Verrucomicrobiota bacterium]
MHGRRSAWLSTSASTCPKGQWPVLNQGTVEFPSRAWLVLSMKRFFYWTAADGKNQEPRSLLVSLIDADMPVQRRLSRSGQRIPIAFLDTDAAEEEQRVPIRTGAIESPRKSVRRERLPRAVCPALGCP